MVQVFTTCGSEAKRDFLLETFPSLKWGNIGDSRSTSFEGLISNATAGQGVDLVLNSLSDEKLQVLPLFQRQFFKSSLYNVHPWAHLKGVSVDSGKQD